jgi:membrane protein YqaA with SNARE-associated domain
MAAAPRPSNKALNFLQGNPMLRSVYDWTIQRAASPAAQTWLAIIAFVESSIFLIPADVLFVPMALAKPSKAYRYALLATVASTLGGIAGYYLGHYAYEEIAKPVLAFYGKLAIFEQLSSSASKDAILLMLVTSGLAHLPPIKIVTILSGAVGVNFGFFVVSCVVARGLRFFALAWALSYYGEAIRDFIERRLGLLAGAASAAILAVFFAARYAL